MRRRADASLGVHFKSLVESFFIMLRYEAFGVLLEKWWAPWTVGRLGRYPLVQDTVSSPRTDLQCQGQHQTRDFGSRVFGLTG